MEARTLLVLLVLAACASREESSNGGSEPARDHLEAFDPRAGIGLDPEILLGATQGDYSLLYVLAPGGASVETQFRGPPQALSAGLWMEEAIEGDEHRLVGGLGNCGFQVTLARWKLDANGRACDVHVRTEPVVEIRPCGERAPGRFVVDCEWRPWIDGRGVGDWRR